MASNCQVPTPQKYVKDMLEVIGYTGELYGKRVLENSCGEGNILLEIVRIYITTLLSKGYDLSTIKSGLESDIVAYEVDNSCIEKCKKRLNELAESYGLGKVKWNIINDDYLTASDNAYHFIIGNPPYITYHDLTESQRDYLKSRFVSCEKGRFDYYYAFLEKGINDLHTDGKLIYLLPYSVLKNKYSNKLREIIKPYTNFVYDFRGISIFPGVTTSSIYIVCTKNTGSNELTYINSFAGSKHTILKNKLIDKWNFTSGCTESRRFGDFFDVSNSVATLYNDAFVLCGYEETEKYILFNGFKLEKDLIHNAVSTKSKKYGKKDIKIIFPYFLDESNNCVKRIKEDELRKNFPQIYKYLEVNKKELLSRKSDKAAAWYEYGRSQALNSIFGKKIIIPMVITNNVTAYVSETGTVPYAGYFVKKKQGSFLTLEDAKRILESQAFYTYVTQRGTPTTKTSYRISVQDIKDFTF